MKEVHVGDVVVYVDPVARQFNALVTAVWGPTCINVVLVSKDEAKTDTYGRQIERNTSCPYGHQPGMSWPHGNYWMFPGEEPRPIQQPTER